MSLYARPSFRRVGPASIIVLVAGMAALWVTFRPTGLTTGNYLGQLAGVEAILLMSIALILISTLPWMASIALRSGTGAARSRESYCWFRTSCCPIVEDL